jgi:glycine amidinotransferase
MTERRGFVISVQTHDTTPAIAPVVNSFTEWDPLEEVVVGRLAGGAFPAWQDSMLATVPDEGIRLFREKGGTPFPADHLAAADAELDQLAAVLAARGIKVVRPDDADFTRGFSTPDWQSNGGMSAGMPRDLLMVLGQTIVETPMSWRCRYYEVDAFRSLIKSYFRRGAGWLAGPRPQLTDELFAGDFDPETETGYAITDFEPVFDAADFMRFGHDVVVQRSHVTNEFGINWLRRAIGDEFRIHEVPVNDPHAMHIDASIVPLAPGKLLVHPERYVPNELFRDWEILEAPKPLLPSSWPMYFCSPWLSVNVLSLDERTVVVERQEEPMIEALTAWGFECVPIDFRHVYTFGGSFHCATLDVRRKGSGGRYLG